MARTIIIIAASCIALALIIVVSILLAKRSSSKKEVPKETIYCKNCIWYLKVGNDSGYCLNGNTSGVLTDCPEKSPKDTCKDATFGARSS
ncbi:hypothetical protein IJI94_01905 [Candidatus Saccharibacteria bacterium]|nr:hypothetical protein [Candidatus Saccharibacteria bacterium]